MRLVLLMRARTMCAVGVQRQQRFAQVGQKQVRSWDALMTVWLNVADFLLLTTRLTLAGLSIG